MSKYEGSVKRRIFDAAKILFSEKGHEETRLREIAAAARTSESQIIKYFKSKAGLLDTLIEDVRIRIDDCFKEAQKITEEPILIFEKISTHLFDLLNKEPELFKVYLFNKRYYALLTEEQLIMEARFQAELSAIFKSGQKSKVFRSDFNTDAAASALWGAILGLMRDKLYKVRSKEFPEVTRRETVTVIRALIASFESHNG